MERGCKFEIKEGDHSETPATDADKLLQDFSSYTTLHGLHFLFDSHSTIRRLIWIVLLLVCISVLVVQFQDNWRKYTSNMSVSSREMVKADSLVFPAVTICNQNMMRKSKIKGKDAQIYLDRMDYLKANFLSLANVSSSFDVEKAVLESGHNISDMIKMCYWQGRSCGPQNFTTSLSFMVS